MSSSSAAAAPVDYFSTLPGHTDHFLTNNPTHSQSQSSLGTQHFDWSNSSSVSPGGGEGKQPQNIWQQMTQTPAWALPEGHPDHVPWDVANSDSYQPSKTSTPMAVDSDADDSGGDDGYFSDSDIQMALALSQSDASSSSSSSSSSSNSSSAAAKDDDEPTCSVCLMPLSESGMGPVRTLSCGHSFHKDCINHWFTTFPKYHEDWGHVTEPHPTCPLCKVQVTVEGGFVNPQEGIAGGAKLKKKKKTRRKKKRYHKKKTNYKKKKRRRKKTRRRKTRRKKTRRKKTRRKR